MMDVLAVALAYVVGSIPFAFLLSRRRGVDLRMVGSGNVGASNVLRTSGVSAAVAAMLLDALKGSCAVVVAQRLAAGPVTPVLAGLASIVGHIYPCWLRFRGGKGVATAAGVFAVLTPWAAALASVTFLIAVGTTRYISIGSMTAAVVLPLVAVLSEASTGEAAGAAGAAAVILHRHRANIARLAHGTERRVGQRLFKGST